MLKQHIATNTSVVATSAPPRNQGASGHTLAAAFEMLGAPIHFKRNTEIYGEGEAAEYLYQVVRGAVRIYKVLEDGRRQIGAFLRQGDVFGLEAGEDHAFSAESIVDCTIRVAKRSSIAAVAARDSEVAADLLASTARSLRGAQEHMLLLGRKTAEERVASFLLKMAGVAERIIELPMSRQDIADYLGLTIETVSRTFTHLENAAAIELASSRRVLVRNRGSLQRLNA